MINRIAFVVCLCVAGITSWGQPLQVKKFTPALTAQLMRMGKAAATDSVDLVVQWQGSGTVQGHRVLRQYGADLQAVRVSGDGLKQWLQQKSLVFAGLSNRPKEELTTGSLDITLNRLNAAHRFYPTIKGEGVHLSIKEQRFDTADIDVRGRVLLSGLEAASNTTHASLMATIAAGGGNSSEEALGAAPAAGVSASSFASLLPDPDTAMQRLGVLVQNHSYGTTVENFYGVEAVAYDRQSVVQPTLLHVFSAGNTGQVAGSGMYQGLSGRANLSGNLKQAKNALTVGALNYHGNVTATSARGPAFDGRVKPELVAFGEDGTSGAAALVSGTAALLQSAYRAVNGTPATSALLRAILLNSAFDVGAPGPDYQSGWGGLDGLAAVQTLQNGRYRTVSVAKGQIITIPVSVPAGIRQLKVTISWTDSAAPANAAKTLRNDLDLAVTRQGTGERWLPWILNPQPAFIDLPAQRGVDTLNNHEQVTIENPAAGTYLLQLDGSRLSHSTLHAGLAWQLDTAGAFAFTFPLRGASLVAGQTTFIRWQGELPAGATLEYTLDGQNWQPVTGGARGPYHASWQVPQTRGWAQVRVRTAAGNSLSDTFVVSSRPALQVGFLCADSVMLHWPASAPAYRLYQLGQRYLEPVQQVADTFAVVRLGMGSTAVFSVAPLVSGREGVRSYAFNSRVAGVDCYFKGFFVQAQTAEQVQLQATLGTLYGVKNMRWQKRTGTLFQDAGAGLGARLSYSITDAQPRKGYNFYRLVLLLADGREVFSEPLAVFHFGSQPVQAYPNPVRSGAMLSFQSSLPGKYEVEVYDLYGRRVQSLKLQDVTTSVPVNWPAGVYLLKILSDEGVVETARVVVY